jgi:thymidylate synthase (FAD)
MHFIRLRADAHAQYEIRAYADVLHDVMRKWVPITTEAFDNHRAGAAQLSKPALEAVRAMLAGEEVEPERFGISKREWRELRALLQLD